MVDLYTGSAMADILDYHAGECELKSASGNTEIFLSGRHSPLARRGLKIMVRVNSVLLVCADIAAAERCDEFHCRGEEYCIDTSKVLCNPLPRYCISKSLRCNGVANCGASDSSDEEGCEYYYVLQYIRAIIAHLFSVCSASFFSLRPSPAKITPFPCSPRWFILPVA